MNEVVEGVDEGHPNAERDECQLRKAWKSFLSPASPVKLIVRSAAVHIDGSGATISVGLIHKKSAEFHRYESLALCQGDG